MSAVISPCEKYRYVLHRSLGSALRWYRPFYIVMLNPSTADATKDDPTIRRCISFARREKATHLIVLNLFALRSTNPEALKTAEDPIGPDNDKHLQEFLVDDISWKVAAWGSHPFAKERAKDVTRRFGPFHCLGKTKDGSPRHPLYVKSDAPLKEWSP